MKTVQTHSLAFLSLIILASVGVTSFSAAAAVLPLSNLSDDHFLPVYCVDTRPFLEMHISSGTGCGVVAQ